MTEAIAVGTLVEHPVWGRGKAVELMPPYVWVYFPFLVGNADGPRRKLRLSAPQLSIAAVQTDPLLDGVPIGGKAKKVNKRGASAAKVHPKPVLHTLDQTVDWFTREYPKLFDDPKLVDHELGYKRDAHKLFVQSFGRGKGEALLDAGEFASIGEALNRLYHATNIPARFEIMAANDGLKSGEAAARLLRAVLTFVSSPDASSFATLVDSVAKLPAPAEGSRVLTWPNVTILPFLADPKKCMVMKPGISKRMALRINFDLFYSSSPTWHTYDALIQMSETLLDRLAPLGARDFIDVQSFMWVTQDLE